MAAPANGRPKRPKKSPPNGTLNGSLNGHANGHANGYADKANYSSLSTQAAPQRKPGRSTTAALTSVVARLTTWYIILTVLCRCPSSFSQLDPSSPRVCTPYLHARSYASPYLEPYYQSYVVPQFEKAKPYVDRFEKQIYSPVATFTKDKYETYGARRYAQAKMYTSTQWDRAVRPQLQQAQDKVKAQYDQHLSPYVEKSTSAATPFFREIQSSLDEIYHLSILPAYEASRPYLQKGYLYGQYVVVRIIFPYVRLTKDTTTAFFNRTVWPQVRVVYGDNVEPQLVRISERLGRYRDQQKVESVAESVGSETKIASRSTKSVPTFVSESASKAFSSASSISAKASTKSGWGVFDDFFGGDAASSTTPEAQKETQPVEPQLSGTELQEKLNEDLRKWQTKFAAAADKGAEDLDQRVGEITKRQVNNGVRGHGRALVVKLETSAETATANLKAYIKQIVQSNSPDASEQDLESAHETVATKTRELGLAIKESAQDVRSWKAAYDAETDSLVQSAVKSTVEVLEKIHGLGLQEVGMRWAWTDGVTYKDWQNYHKLRSTLTEWQSEVEAVGSRHEGLRVAHVEAKALEDEAMDIATRSVNELLRLKEVARWKIWAEDASNDFTNQKIPARVFKASSKASDAVTKAASQISESFRGSSTPLTESIASSVSSLFSDASSSVVDEIPSSIASAASKASVKASHAASESAAQASSAGASPKKVFGGVNAQVFVQARQVVYDEPLEDDDDETYSEKLQDVVVDVGERAAQLSSVISEAILGATKTRGSVESATSLASEQYSKAIAAASSVLYGTKQPAVESATSVASERFAQAVTAASYAIYGTPTPTAIISTIHTHASSRYNEAVSLASDQLESAKSQLSLLVSGTPKPAHETMLSYFERAYSDSVAVASERLQAALQYTDSVKSYAAGPTQGYFESVSSIASSRLSEAISQASAQFTAQPTPAFDGARRQYYEALGLAHARYSEFVGAASSAVYGPEQGTIESIASVASASAASIASQASMSAQSVGANAQFVGEKAQSAAQSVASQVSSGVIGSETPWTESVASQASVNWDALISKASNQVYGAPTPWAQSVYSQAGAYGAQATAGVAQQYSDVQALISELVLGKEPAFTESVMNRFSSAYYTGVPAAVSSASSYASEQYGAASSYAGDTYESASSYASDAYASASSIVSSIFTPPAAIETILSQASAQLDAAVDSASIAVYGTPKGAAEKASESIASAYSSIQSQVSEAVYGTQQAQDRFSAAAVSAQAAISEAIFGTPTAQNYVVSVTSGASAAYASVSSGISEQADTAYSVVTENAAFIYSAASSAVYGPEQGALESASSRMAAYIEAANSRMSEIYEGASRGAEEAASSVASVAAGATQRVKDEL